MRNYFFIILILILTALPLVSSLETIGMVKQNDCITLPQTCDNCTYVNISSILYPNKTTALTNVPMTKDGVQYNYTYCNTRYQGTYIVNTFGDDDGITASSSYTFEVTSTGFEFTQPRAVYYIALLFVMLFLFVLCLYIITKLPTRDDTDDWGTIISINHLKYFRPVLIITAWILLVSLVFTSSNVALAYLGTGMFGNLLFYIYRILFWLTLPMLFFWFIYLFVQIFRDKEVKKMIERGVDIPGSP